MTDLQLTMPIIPLDRVWHLKRLAALFGLDLPDPFAVPLDSARGRVRPLPPVRFFFVSSPALSASTAGRSVPKGVFVVQPFASFVTA